MLSIFEMKYLIPAIISLDVVLIVICAYIIHRIRSMPKSDVLEQGLKIHESLLKDVDKIVQRLQKQVQHKHDLIENHNMQLDRRIDSLTTLLNRADIILTNSESGLSEMSQSHESPQQRRMKIMTLAGKGCKPEDIAKKLLIPQGEVKLVLDLTKKFK